jgi:N-acetylmuramoyl-L-alanine amidase
MADCISRRLWNRRRARALWLAGALLAAGVCPAAGKPDSSRVTAVRFWSLGDVTRVAVEVSSEFRYKYDRLSNPDRLFYDIEGARPDMAPKGTHSIPVGDGLLKQIRVAETQPDVTRIVLDLEQPATISASQLFNPDRLIIELRAKDRPLPPATPGVTGGKELTGPPPREIVAATEVSQAAVIEPVVSERAKRPEPRTFIPPPPQPAARPAAIEPIAPPTLPVFSKNIRPPSVPASLRREVAPPPPAPAPIVAAETAPVTAPEPAKIPPAADALPARRNTGGDRSLTRALGLKLGRVVLDPGHGGHDVGTHGPSGLYEKDLVLDIAQRLGALIDERLGSEVVYTRTDDTFIPLEERTRIANEHKADLFLSIHANSSPLRSAAGVETYVLNFTTSRAAMDLAARENASSDRSIFDLQELLQKIALRDKADESREFASRLQTSLSALSTRSNDNAKNRGVKKAPFVVLIGAAMPSVLAEIGFLTNASDEALLRKTEHREKIAEALYKGIAAYADTLSHFTIARKQ